MAALLSHSGWAAQTWTLRAASPQSASWVSRWNLVPQLTPAATRTATDWNWLPQAVCGTWLYNCLTPTYFLWAYASALNSTTSTGQGDIPISSTGCTYFAVLPLIYTGASLDWRLGRGSIFYTNHTHNNHTQTHIHVYIYIYVCVCVCGCVCVSVCSFYSVYYFAHLLNQFYTFFVKDIYRLFFSKGGKSNHMNISL